MSALRASEALRRLEPRVPRALRVTLARRVCAYCHRTLGFSLWPWSGSWVCATHALCARCARRDPRVARPVA